jgi:uncharacterized protein with ParB-like and HNH nuclease domain
MQQNELELRSVDQLLNESFFVPAYQRGYRWTTWEVTELLNDVFTFIKEKRKSKGEFYCLQPVVVARREKHWELIDGQQRLTTIFLILSYFNSRFAEDYKKELFSINYETRPGSWTYLRSLDEEGMNKNIDFYHIRQSYQAIGAWFKDKTSQINDIESAFLNDVKVIWYEVRHNIDPISVFTRLNVGKIQLTNAELVKALFLRSSNFEAESKRVQHINQLKIAQEWDDMERRLRDDEFWFFLTNKDIESNRLEFVLNLRADELKTDPALRRNKYYLFLSFNQHLMTGSGCVTSEWEQIKRLFLLLDEWFKDRYLYHLIGFLVNQHSGTPEATILRIKKLSEESTSKTDFKRKLKDEVFYRLFSRNRETCNDSLNDNKEIISNFLVGMDYGSNKIVIRNILLLFNLVSLLENEKANVRFPFNFFKTEQWDIEHIRSVQSNMPLRPDDQKRWLDNVLAYLSGPANALIEASAEADTQLTRDATTYTKLLAVRNASNYDSEAFVEVFNEIIERYDPNPDYEVDNSIGNLTLLDSATNRSYKNAIFPIKRQTLISLDKVGKFVPLCTKNAFLKYYSPKINEMLIWTKEDTAAHQAAMVESLARFFAKKGA